jgi:hypothetical protein
MQAIFQLRPPIMRLWASLSHSQLTKGFVSESSKGLHENANSSLYALDLNISVLFRCIKIKNCITNRCILHHSQLFNKKRLHKSSQFAKMDIAILSFINCCEPQGASPLQSCCSIIHSIDIEFRSIPALAFAKVRYSGTALNCVNCKVTSIAYLLRVNYLGYLLAANAIFSNFLRRHWYVAPTYGAL